MENLKDDNIVFVNTQDDLHTVLSCFKINKISHVPVKDESKLVGIISKTDVVEYLYDHQEDLGTESFASALKKIKAKEVMMQPLVKARTSDTQMFIMEKLIDHDISSVVLQDDDGKLAGIVTDKDMLHYLLRDKESSMSFTDKLGGHIVQWMDQNGILRISKALSDIGI